jgi:uncharacterized membrane protein
MHMITIGQVHLASAIVALAAGAWTVWRPKGTAAHRRVGWSYAASMLTLNVTALMIYRLTGTFGPFHVAALISLATVIFGIVPAWKRRPAKTWLDRHYFWMTYSYVGLLAATVAETATRIPALQAFAGGPTLTFWTVVVVSSLAVFVVGSRIIRHRFEGTTRPFRTSASVQTGL